MRWLTLALLLIPLAGCPSGGEDGGTAPGDSVPAATPAASNATAAGESLLVWADPLLHIVLEGLKDEFETRYAPGYSALYLERGELTARLAEDEPPPLPDVFVIADQEVFTALREGGFIDEATARTFAGDRLALVQQVGEGYECSSLFDVYKLRFDQFALGEAGTAVGYYGEQALITEGCFARLTDRLVRYGRTAELIGALSGVPRRLGIVCASTVVQRSELEVVMLISEERHQDIRYLAMASAGRGTDKSIAALLRFLAEEEEIQTLLGGYGLLDRDEALIENK